MRIMLKGMMVKIRYWFFPSFKKLPTEMFFQANWIRIEIELDLCCFLLFDAITLYGNGFFFSPDFLYLITQKNWSSFMSFFFFRLLIFLKQFSLKKKTGHSNRSQTIISFSFIQLVIKVWQSFVIANGKKNITGKIIMKFVHLHFGKEKLLNSWNDYDTAIKTGNFLS